MLGHGGEQDSDKKEAERSALVDHIVDLQTHLAELLERDRARLWLDIELTIQQLKVVFILVRAGALTAGQIGHELNVGVSTVTGLVDRLAEQGLVSRGEDPHDRRATRVVPTDAGRALVERLYAFRSEALRSLLEHVPTDRLQALASGLEGVELAAHERLRPDGDTATAEDTH